jgi:pimeloyl-ACP methyl ester carboxylesterase
MIYAWRYPESIHRSVMIGVNPPGHFLWDTQTFDSQIGHYGELCSEDPACRSRTADLAALMRRTSADMPDRWLFLTIKPGNVKVHSFFGLMESTYVNGQPSASMTFDAWMSAAEGDASGLWLQTFLVDLIVPEAFVWGEYAAAAGSLDAEAAREYFSSSVQDPDSIAYAGSAFSWGEGELADAWPATPDIETYRRGQASEVETLLIGGSLDTSTPPNVAADELLPFLPNGRQIVFPSLGHTLSFFAEQPGAGSRLINTYFDSGLVDDSLYQPQSVDFTPATTLGGMAKTIFGLMVALVVLTIASLIWMAHRVHRRGGFGPKTSAVLRSVYPILSGLGGWCLGALIVLTAFPALRIDNQPVTVLFVGMPVGLGIYWAWVERDWPARVKAAGFAAAVGVSVVGAWLGFNATQGLSSLFTAIVGAAAMSNLALIFLDLFRTRGGGRKREAMLSVDQGRQHVGAA